MKRVALGEEPTMWSASLPIPPPLLFLMALAAAILVIVCWLE
jgi:hypothetical protein